MELVIENNVREIQRQYIDSIIQYFMDKNFPYDFDDALKIAINIYKQMITSLKNLVNSISDRYSQFQKYHLKFPIFTFQSSGGSMWYFAYARSKNNDVVVFDMQNVNRNKGKTFVNNEVQKSLDFMKRLLEVKI